MEASAISSMMALLREGHLAAVFQMFSFLKSQYNGVTVFDSTEPEIDQAQFPTEEQSATSCVLCKEDDPLNTPAPKGIGFTIRAFVDSNHVRDSITRLLRTGFIISSTALLSLFIQRNRGVVGHQFLVQSLLQ